MVYRSPCPHIRQSSQLRNCGAACLAMVFQKYRKRGKLKEITKGVSILLSNGVPSCRNSLMVKYAISSGFDCSVVAAKDIRTLIPLCLQSKIDILISYHTRLDSPSGHFSVVTGMDERYVYVNDPERDMPAGIDVPLEIDDLTAKMKANSDKTEIVVDNTMLLLAPKSLHLPILEIEGTKDGTPYSIGLFECVINDIYAFVDPELDQWLPFDAAASATSTSF